MTGIASDPDVHGNTGNVALWPNFTLASRNSNRNPAPNERQVTGPRCSFRICQYKRILNGENRPIAAVGLECRNCRKTADNGHSSQCSKGLHCCCIPAVQPRIPSSRAARSVRSRTTTVPGSVRVTAVEAPSSMFFREQLFATTWAKRLNHSLRA